jgi:hypothetical protein
MRLLGFSPGAQPKNVVERKDDPTGRYHDIIAYNQPLTDDECYQYDLDYIECKPFDGGSVILYYYK